MKIKLFGLLLIGVINISVIYVTEYNKEDVEDIGPSTWSIDDEEIITQTKDSSPTQIMVKLSIGYAYQDKEAIEYVKSQRPLVVKTVKNYFLKKKKTEIENLKKVKLELVSELEDVLGNGYINKIDFKEFHMVAP